jgi:O-antigen ligase
MIEPSPYDVLLVLLLLTGCLFSAYRYDSSVLLPVLFLLLFLLSNVLSAFFAKDFYGAIFYFAITVYLAVSWAGIIGLSFRYPGGILNAVFKGYVVAALIAVLVGLFAYFVKMPATEAFLQFGRVKSLFKDPNVFGPFIVPAAVYSLYLAEKSSLFRSKLIHFFLFLLFMVGVLLSFSRAAWANSLLTLGCFYLLHNGVPFRNRMATMMACVTAGSVLLIYLSGTPMIENLLEQRLGMQHYDEDRFATQRAAFEAGFANLIGFGPGQSEENFEISTHSLYARLFTENGILGILSFGAFFLITVCRAFKQAIHPFAMDGGLYLVVFSSLVGLAFNSVFIDTLHWRHFWLLLALAWCLDVPKDQEQRGMQPDAKGEGTIEDSPAYYKDG